MDAVESSLVSMASDAGVHYLQCGSVVINNIRFLGCTLWSQVDHIAYNHMNDSKRVFYACYPDHVHRLHDQHVAWLNSQLNIPTTSFWHTTVVVTHHLPSFDAVADSYKHKLAPTISGYASDLNYLIHQHKHVISSWICAHAHYRHQATIEGVPVYINPVGYPGEKLDHVIGLMNFELQYTKLLSSKHNSHQRYIITLLLHVNNHDVLNSQHYNSALDTHLASHIFLSSNVFASSADCSIRANRFDHSSSFRSSHR